ncbi:MAG: Ig-like domain-containing protein [Cyclobacteriaceae bacterium]
MSARKKILIILVMACVALAEAQNLHLSQSAFFEGETISGVAYFSNQSLLSHSYYISIYSEENTLIARELLFVTKGNTSFQIVIPENTKSGYYIFQIANYHNSIVTHTSNILILNEDDWSQVKMGQPRDRLLPRSAESSIDFNVIQNQNQAHLKFQPTAPLSSAIKNVSVSVTDLKQNPLSLDSNIRPISQAPCNLETQHMVSDQNLQDWLYGYQVTGTVTDQNNDPIVDCPVIFSYTQDKLVFSYTKTNEFGKFGFFNLDVSGKFEGYIQALSQDTSKSITINVLLPTEGLGSNPLVCESKFYLDSTQLAEIVRIRMLRKKVQSGYTTNEKKPIWSPEEPKPLLKNPDHLIKLEDYVALKTTKEVFKEIVPHAFLVKNRLRVFSPELRKTLTQLPLLLINGIPARDKEIFELPPHEIAYIEVLNELTKLVAYGDYALGGIISVITKNDFEHGSYLNKVEFKGFTPSSRAISPLKTSSEPFFPSVLYWNPQLNPDDDAYKFSIDLPAYNTTVLISAVFQLTNGSIISHEEIVTLNNTYEK